MLLKKAYRDFNEKRMFIFQELIKAFWNGDVKKPSDLECLANLIKNKYGFDDSDIPFIRDHMRVAMGQDPKEGRKFRDELDRMKLEKINHPIVTNVEGPCEFCDEHNDKCLSCGYCVSECDFGAIADKIEFIPTKNLLEFLSESLYKLTSILYFYFPSTLLSLHLILFY